MGEKLSEWRIDYKADWILEFRRLGEWRSEGGILSTRDGRDGKETIYSGIHRDSKVDCEHFWWLCSCLELEREVCRDKCGVTSVTLREEGRFS